MPELPEVERAANMLRAAIGGRILSDVRLLHPSLRRRVSSRTLRSLRGARVRDVERRGKHQLVHLEDDRVIHVHFRMNGDWEIGTSSDPLPRFARAIFQFVDGTRVVLEDSRALSTVEVHRDAERIPLKLGPEPNDPALTSSRLREALSKRRVPIKVALLDQRVIAGLGNIYTSEALWRAKVDPRREASTLASPEVARLLNAVRVVLARATGGRYSRLEGARLDVYGREGEPCRRCRALIQRIRQAGRSTYFCPRCQMARRRQSVSPAPAGARP